VAEPIRVLVVDDHQVVRQGLRVFLDVQPDLDVVGEAGDGETAVALVEELAPDVVLLDLKMPGMGGVDTMRLLRDRGVPARVLVLTSYTDPASVVPALRAGAAGYVYKDIEPEALAQAIRAVNAGRVLLEPAVAAALLDGDPGAGRPERHLPALTDREREVLGQLALGRSNREIARALVVAEKTVKTHVSSILSKLDLADRTQAALYAVRTGLDGQPRG